jgi:hypothetical protein
MRNRWYPTCKCSGSFHSKCNWSCSIPTPTIMRSQMHNRWWYVAPIQGRKGARERFDIWSFAFSGWFNYSSWREDRHFVVPRIKYPMSAALCNCMPSVCTLCLWNQAGTDHFEATGRSFSFRKLTCKGWDWRTPDQNSVLLRRQSN